MPNTYQIFVNAGQIAFIDKSINPLTREDILHSSLMAQLLADKPPHEHVEDWQHNYMKGRGKLHWIVSANSALKASLQVNQSVTMVELIALGVQQIGARPSVTEKLKKLVSHKLKNLHFSPTTNRPLLSVLRQNAFKTITAQHRNLIIVEVLIAKSPSVIYSISVTLENEDFPDAIDWLNHEIRAEEIHGEIKIQNSTYALRSKYHTLRDTVIHLLMDRAGTYIGEMEIPSDELETPTSSS